MAWWIPMAIGAAGSVIQANSASKQNSNQLSWNRYNSQMAYNTEMANVEAGLAIGGLNAAAQMAAGQANAAMEMAAGKFNAQLEMMGAEFNARAIGQIAQYNASLISLTTDYNTTLLEDEEAMMWEAAELDLLHLANQRAIERGQIEGQQAASGVVMGQDSAADVIISQQAQAELDSFVVRHNANREAERIRIEIDKNVFSGQLAWQQTMFQGAMDQHMTRTNAKFRALGIMANASLSAAGTIANASLGAAATMGQAQIGAAAGRASARYGYNAGIAGAQMQYDQNKTSIKNNLVSGLFGAAASGATNYFSMKPTSAGQSLGFTTQTQKYSTATRSASQLARQGSPAWERVLRGQMTQPGTSLM